MPYKNEEKSDLEINRNWCIVELYRWEHGELPPNDGTAKNLCIKTALKRMALAMRDPDFTNWPTPFALSMILEFVSENMGRIKDGDN